MAEKRCSKCGRLFHCGNEARGCWCENHQLSAETLRMLREQYDNCLCEPCLSQLAEKQGESGKKS